MPHKKVRLGLLLIGLAIVAYAKWGGHSKSEIVFASTPPDASALLELQSRVQATVQKVLPAIVAIKGAYSPSDHISFASGIIITADGLVLSQFHVSHRLFWQPGEPVRSLQPGKRTEAILSNGQKVEAELLGADQAWDLSLLRLLEPGPYEFVSIEPTADAQIGDWMLKLGHPLGYRADRPAVVRLGRVLYRDEQRFVTDCIVDGGDSGGPLIDLNGRIAGIIGSSGIPVGLRDKGPAMLFNCVNRSVVKRQLPGMLRREVSPVDKSLDDEENKRYADAKDFLPLDQWTHGKAMAAAFQNVGENLTAGTVAIQNELGQQTALGTIVDSDGLIMTVASLLPAEPKCHLTDDRLLSATLVGVNPAYDLALLKLPISNLRPVESTTDSAATAAGTLLVAPMPDKQFSAVGIVSVPVRNLPGPFATRLQRPKIQAEIPGLFGTISDEGFRLESVDVIGTNAGIEVGDILVSIAGQEIHAQEDVWASAKGRLAGERVSVRVLHEGKSLEFPIEFAARPLIRSKPYANYPTLFEHDIPLPLNCCGGPVTDINGRAVGITMYRGSYGCMAIPFDCIQRLLPELKSGELANNWIKPDPVVGSK